MPAKSTPLPIPAKNAAVAIYMRVSTEEQREKQPILMQRDHAQRYCALNDLTIAGIYGDEGVSGTVPLEQRPEGARFLHDARARRFGGVLVYKLDRLGRRTRLILSAVDDLAALGVEIRSMTEPFDTGNATGRFMLTMLAGFGELERETTLERSSEQTNRLAREGQWLGGIVPFGYRVAGAGRTARLVVSEAPVDGVGLSEADVVRRIYGMVAARQSCQKVAAYLNSLGIPPVYVRDGREITRGKRKTATSGLWRPARIRSLITNTTYKGIHQYGKRAANAREIIEREVPAARAHQMRLLRPHVRGNGPQWPTEDIRRLHRKDADTQPPREARQTLPVNDDRG